jgi:LacI family transcriptional regulator
MLSPRRRVALFLPTGPAYFAGVFEGIGAYCHGRCRWTIVGWPSNYWPREAEMRRAIRQDRIDGVIAGATDFWASILVRKKRLAFVNIEHSYFPAIPRVGLDEEAIGHQAAEHFRQRGLKHVAAVGQARWRPSMARLAALTRAAEPWCRGGVHRYESPVAVQTPGLLLGWLRALPRPVGIFCWNDETAKVVHQACEAAGLRIPEDAALVGVDNDELLCRFLDPPLSSVDVDAQQVGYEAAALLERLMDGQPAPAGPVLIAPRGVVARASTEMLATRNENVLAAVRFIRDHATQPLRVEDVLKHVAVSRRSLEKQFRAALGRTPLAEIHRVAVERAQDLLANTDLSVPAVATRCGYRRANHFTVMFRKQTGQTPTAYRLQTRRRE